MKLWRRHLTQEILKFLLFFLSCAFLLYTLVDFSLHSGRFFSYGKNLSRLPLYYLFLFLEHLDLFLPIALMLATIKVLCKMNLKRELVALQMGGLSLKKLFSPFLTMSFISTFLIYVNIEFIQPQASISMENYKKSSLSKKKNQKAAINVMLLKDGSKLIYHNLDSHKKELQDVFWIKSKKEIWHMQTICLTTYPPQGVFVDKLIKNKGFFEKKSSSNKLSLPMKLQNIKAQTTFSPSSSSISMLIKDYFSKSFSSRKERSAIATHLCYKLAIPLFSLLMIIALFPFCVQFSRTTNTFLISALALFGALTFFALLDSAIILGENGVTSPLLLIWGPLLLLLLFFGRKLVRSTF